MNLNGSFTHESDFALVSAFLLYENNCIKNKRTSLMQNWPQKSDVQISLNLDIKTIRPSKLIL
jgi:hypothetical protein